jgi:phosphoglycolate phosphatase
MKGIKLIIFDLDGTLVDAYLAIISSFNYTMARLSCAKQSDSIIRKAVGWGDENLLKPFIDSKEIKRALSIYRKHHKISLLRKSRLLPGTLRVLAYLKKHNYKLAIASNRPTRFCWILLKHLKLKKYFDYILCADKLKHIKPHPEIIHRIIQRLKVLAKETIYVGDMTIDAQAGRRAKVRTIIVTTGSNTKQEIQREKPYRLISKLEELLDNL